MCMIQDCDGYWQMFTDETRTARKEHKCSECRRAIQPCEKYTYESGVFEGDFQVSKTCAHCKVARDWLMAECNGWMYTMVREDIEEHYGEGYGGMKLARIAVGMKRKWKQFHRPGLLPIPQMPEVTK